MKNKPLFAVFTALFAAIICVGNVIAIPLPGGVPIVLQNMLAVLTGALLGGVEGVLPTLLFLAAGALGLPVFSAGTGGIAKLLGPTGGFLYGYALGALLAALIIGRPKGTETTKLSVLRALLATIAGLTVLYIPGVIHFMNVTGKDFNTTMAACVIPFIPGYFVKIVLSTALTVILRPVVYRYLYAEDVE